MLADFDGGFDGGSLVDVGIARVDLFDFTDE